MLAQIYHVQDVPAHDDRWVPLIKALEGQGIVYLKSRYMPQYSYKGDHVTAYGNEGVHFWYLNPNPGRPPNSPLFRAAVYITDPGIELWWLANHPDIPCEALPEQMLEDLKRLVGLYHFYPKGAPIDAGSQL